jgi:hypothetical protein
MWLEEDNDIGKLIVNTPIPYPDIIEFTEEEVKKVFKLLYGEKRYYLCG